MKDTKISNVSNKIEGKPSKITIIPASISEEEIKPLIGFQQVTGIGSVTRPVVLLGNLNIVDTVSHPLSPEESRTVQRQRSQRIIRMAVTSHHGFRFHS